MTTSDHTIEPCTRCGTPLPRTLEYFYSRGKASGTLDAICKACRKAASKRRYHADPEADNARSKTYRQRNLESIKEQRRGYYQLNRDAIREKQRAYYDATRDERLAACARYRAANPDAVAESKRRSYMKNKEQRRLYYRQWAKVNPQKAATPTRNYKIRKRNAPGSHTAADIVLLYRSQKGLCWWCEKPVGDAYHVDHRIPLDKGGSNDARNLCISCQPCNNSKYNRLPHEWIGRLL